MMKLFVIVVALFTLDQLKAEKCDTACSHLGYDIGAYNPKSNQCLCGDKKDYDETVLKKRVILPHLPPPPPRKDSYTSYHSLWD